MRVAEMRRLWPGESDWQLWRRHNRLEFYRWLYREKRLSDWERAKDVPAVMEMAVRTS